MKLTMAKPNGSVGAYGHNRCQGSSFLYMVRIKVLVLSWADYKECESLLLDGASVS